MTIAQPCHPVGAALLVWPHSGFAPAGRPFISYLLSLMLNRSAAAALAAGLAFGSCALAVCLTAGINQALALAACREDAALARISADHCALR